MTSITSKTIGVLKQNDQFDDWWESNQIKIPFFDKKEMKISFMGLVPEDDPEFIEDADEALDHFLKKGKSDRLELSEIAYRNCMNFLNAIGYDEADEKLWKINEKHDIWNFIYPREILVSRRDRRDKDIYLMLARECECEQEHGLQLGFRQGRKLTRISDQDGHLTEADAYDKPDTEDYLLSRFEMQEIPLLPEEPTHNTSEQSNSNQRGNKYSKPWW